MSGTPSGMERAREVALQMACKIYSVHPSRPGILLPSIQKDAEEAAQILADLLAEREAQARLEEAKDWLVIVESLFKHSKRDQHAKRCVSECRQRVADLELAALRTDGKGKPTWTRVLRTAAQYQI